MDFFCTDCDAAVKIDDKFCSNCGRNVEEIVNNSTTECSSCGTEVDGSLTFCSSCGSKLNLDLTNYDLSEKEIRRATLHWYRGPIIAFSGLLLSLLIAGIYGLISSNKGSETVEVNENSIAYKQMFIVGQNFARLSMSGDTATSQCNSALQSGFINVRGAPQYLGIQTEQIQSYLRTSDGMQGCLDGFNK